MKLKTCKTIEEIQEEFDKPSIFAKYWETEEIEILLKENKKLKDVLEGIRKDIHGDFEDHELTNLLRYILEKIEKVIPSKKKQS